MFQTFRNAWKIPELKNRLLFTLAILVVYRLGCAIPVPFVTSSALTQMFSNGNMLTYLDMMSGGALSRCTLFALGVTPYINASIIVQLLTVAIPSLENIAKEPDGQQKLQQITRYAGGIIALIMSLGYYFVVRNMGALKYTSGAAGIFTAVVIIATFTAGAQLITWCGEQIDDKGIGNGLSLLIFSSIVSNWSSLYTTVAGLLTRAAAGEPVLHLPARSGRSGTGRCGLHGRHDQRRAPHHHPVRQACGGPEADGRAEQLPAAEAEHDRRHAHHLRFRSGLDPGHHRQLFADRPGRSPGLVCILFHTFNYTSWLYVVIYLLLILAFNYFYVAIQYNPVEIANNLRRNNGSIPGFRPGKPTSDFITRTLNKITLIGAIFLAAVAVLPIILGNLTGMSIQLGGTSLLIVVGVALDTTRSLDSFMTMRNHKGFLG